MTFESDTSQGNPWELESYEDDNQQKMIAMALVGLLLVGILLMVLKKSRGGDDEAEEILFEDLAPVAGSEAVVEESVVEVDITETLDEVVDDSSAEGEDG